VTRMRAELELLKAGASYEELAIAEAEVEQARAQIAEVQTDLERLTVRAPMASTVLQVGIRPGEFVGTPPGETLMVLGNVQQLHLRVDIDEHDIPRFAPGAKAQAVMRGYPDRVFQLDFIRVQPFVVPKRNLTGDNTEQVDTRVLQAIYAFREPPGEDLYVGQQLDVYVATLNGPNMEGRRGPPGRAQATAAAVE
jgi:HlyD family secretion protein